MFREMAQDVERLPSQRQLLIAAEDGAACKVEDELVVPQAVV
jgi:hypothetical protein